MRKLLLTSSCISLLFCCFNAVGQSFFRSYITSGSTVSPMRYASVTPDSGLIFTVDGGIQKLDKNGNTQWAKSVTPPTIYSPSPRFVISSSTGSYFIEGCYNKLATGDLDSNWIAKISPSGTCLFNKVYHLYIWNMCATNDGGFLLAGMAREQVHFTYLNYIIRCDSNGNIVWKKQYDDTSIGYVYNIVPSHTSGNFVVMAGYSGLAAPNNFVHCFEINSSGNILWQKKYRTADSNLYNPFMLVKAPGGYLLSTEYANAPATDPSWKLGLIKIDNSGNVVWTGQYNDATMSLTGIQGMDVNTDGKILVSGIYGTSSLYQYYMLDSNGNVVWGKTSSGISGGTTYGMGTVTATWNKHFFVIGYGPLTVPAAMIDNYGNGLCVSSALTMTRSSLPITTWPLAITAVDSPGVAMPITPLPVSSLTFHDTTYCLSATTGEETLPSNQSITRVYPNPAVNELNVLPQSDKWQNIKLTGMDGRIERIITGTNSIASKEVQINTGNLPEGIYCLQIIYADGERETFKVVISK